MYDIQDIGPTNKEVAVSIIVVFVFLVVIFGCGYMLGLRHAGTGVPDHGDGVGHVGEQLGTAAVNQRELTEGIGNAETGVARVEAGIQHVSESVAITEAAVGDAGGLIDECQQILGRVRNRGQAHPVKN